jgi:hypothetical protein
MKCYPFRKCVISKKQKQKLYVLPFPALPPLLSLHALQLLPPHAPHHHLDGGIIASSCLSLVLVQENLEVETIAFSYFSFSYKM